MTTSLGVAGAPTGPDSVPILDRWARWMRAQSWSERTIADRVALVERVAGRYRTAPELLTVDQVLEFLSQSSFGATSRKTYHEGLKSWFRWLVHSEKLLLVSPMDGLPSPVARKRSARRLSTEHLEHLLSTRMHARTRAMILLGAYQGLRVSEIAKFRGSDIDMRSRELYVLGKGDVEARMPLHPIVEALAREHPTGWWFPQWTTNRSSSVGGHILGNSVSSVVAAAMKRAGVPGSAHSLRHWHATTLLSAGVDSRVTQELMRHSSISTTQLYMHVDDRQRRAGLLLLPDVTSPQRPTDSSSPSFTGVTPPGWSMRDAA